MEYQIFNTVRNKIKIPFVIRIVLGIICILLGFLGIILPIIPGFIFVVAGVLLIIPGTYIKNIIKIRKNFSHLFLNINKWEIVKQKIRDLYTQAKIIFKKMKE